MWAIYSKSTNTPFWKSTDRETLAKILVDITDALGNNFYLKKYKEK